MIVITSGHWNPLHRGHLEYLNKSWEYCNQQQLTNSYRLTMIVVVNNDAQVKLKGSIPFLNEDVRYDIISNLWMVDQAIIAREVDSSVANTLKWIAKEYKDEDMCFVNSGDRKSANPKEHEVCEKYGIEEVFLDLPKINSSSEILDAVGKEWASRQTMYTLLEECPEILQ